MAKANEEKSGDTLAGLGAASAEERVAAKVVLSQIKLSELRNNPAVPYEEDEVTRIIQDAVNERIYSEIQNWTVEELREWILNENTTEGDIKRISRGLTAEMIAAVAKIMTNLDLIYGAKKSGLRRMPTRRSDVRARCRHGCSRITRQMTPTVSWLP